MLALLRQRSFAMLWAGQLISQIGDMVLLIALPFYVYQLTGSLLQTGAMYIAETIPRILFGSLAGVFVDRWDRRQTMIVSDVGRAVLLLALLAVRSPSGIWLIYAVGTIQSAFGLFFAPALTALMPTLIEPEQLVAANGLQSVSESLMRLAGPPLGGALFALVGITGVVFVDSMSFVCSAIFVLFVACRPSSPPMPAHGAVGMLGRQVWNELLDGMQVIRQHSAIGALFITYSLFACSQGIAAAPLIVFVREVLGGSALTLGWMAMAQGIGSLLGATLVARANAVAGPARMVGIPLIIAGCIVLLFTNIPVLIIALPLITLMGVVIVGFLVASQTLIQLHIADCYRGRVAGALGMLTALMSLIGMLAASLVGDLIGPVVLLDASGSLTALAGMVGIVALSRSARFEQPHNVLEIG